jgi:hypothetical protein
VAASYSGFVTLHASDANALIPALQTFTTALGGQQTVSGLVWCVAGTQALSATDGTLTANANLLVSTTILQGFCLDTPASVQAGSVSVVTASACDAYGNVIADHLGSANVTSSDGAHAGPSTLVFAAASGGMVHVRACDCIVAERIGLPQREGRATAQMRRDFAHQLGRHARQVIMLAQGRPRALGGGLVWRVVIFGAAVCPEYTF